MFKLNLKIALRNLWKHKGYTLINVLGLSIGMASCILIFLFIRYQLTFDKDFKNGDRIYRFVTDWKYNSFDDYSQGVPIPLSAAARNEIPGLEKVAPIVREEGMITVRNAQGGGLTKEDRRIFYTTADFFAIFDLGWVAGGPAELDEPNTTVLSAETATRYFGNAGNALGKIINYRNGTLLKVVGVFSDMPENTSLPLEIVFSYQTFYGRNDQSWGDVSSGIQCYFLLNKGIDISHIRRPLNKLNDKYYRSRQIAGNQHNKVQALSDIHFNERYGSYTGSSVTRKHIYGLTVIGLFLIVTACINFVNLATAQAINRSKEVGVRKVMGSRRSQLVSYFLTETLTITLFSLLIACILVEIALPGMRNLFEVKTAFSLFGHPVIFLFAGVLVVSVSFLAGFYPAMVISGFSPVLAIKNKVKVNAGGLSLRKVLVIMQFSITVVLIISTIVIIRQMEYMRRQPLGFDSDAVVMINAPGDKAEHQSFREKILSIPGVIDMSYCARPPLSNDMNTTNFSFNGQENKDFEVRLSPADEHYFKVFGLQLIAGKVFAPSDTATGYVVNETFLKKVFIRDPQEALWKIIDQNGRVAPIVGVVKDYNDQSLQRNISPILIYQQSSNCYAAGVKIEKSQVVRVMKEMELLWKRTFPDLIYYPKFLDSDIEKYYQSEKITGILFRVFAGVIIFISFIGLFGLISFVAVQRTKEMAIRKVLGASTYQLVGMLNGSFLLMAAIANLIAWPLAYLFVNGWLSGFAYRMPLDLWPFMFAALVSILLTFFIVSLRSYCAAMTNPIDALKYE